MANLASLLLLLGAAQGVFFGLVLLGLPSGNRRANRWLAVFLLVFSVGMVGTVLFDLKVVLQYPHLGLLHTPLAPLTGASLFLYIKALTENNFRFRGRQWLHLLPALISAILLVPFYVMPAGEKREVLAASYSDFPVSWKINFIFATLVNTGYLLATLVTIIRHERHIRQLYSNTANKTLLWVRNFLVAGAAIFLTCVVMSVFNIPVADSTSNLLFAFLIYVMGYRALRQPEIFADLPEQIVVETGEPDLVKTPAKYEKSGLTDEKARALLTRLDVLFTEENIYLDPELTLQQLADRLGVTAHQVSQLLNQFKGQPFFDFVNSRRVEHFKAAVANPVNAHLSILAVALDSGFNSKAAFNAVFKKMTGLTPSAFRRTVMPDLRSSG